MPRRSAKKTNPVEPLGYFIGPGQQNFGSSRCYRCAFCRVVLRTCHQMELHEADCAGRASVQRRARVRRV